MGEDCIINHFLKYVLKINRPYYLDIGANEPFSLSNTAFFYKNYKSDGVLVEPNPILCKKLKKYRKRDIVLNAGIAGLSAVGGGLPFYIMNYHTLSTFNYEQVKEMEMNKWAYLEKTINIELLNIMDVINNFCKRVPNIISLDAEGYDLEILQTIDFDKIRPEIFIIETIKLGKLEKEEKCINYLKTKGYMAVADTFINTIFLDEEKLNKHYKKEE